jgi:hypothetical protein
VSIAVILLIAGLIAGLSRGGKLESISKVDFKHAWLVFAGLTIQVGGELTTALVFPELSEGFGGIALLALSYFLLITFVALNFQLPGMYFIGAGLALNLIVIFLNGGMPVSLDAVRAAGFEAADYLETAVKHEPFGRGTILGFLGDIIPIPIIRRAVSIGDVVLGIGIFRLVEQAVRYDPQRAIGRAAVSARVEEP